MRKSKFTHSQIMDAVKRVEAGFAVPDICLEMGISTATFYKWRAKYGGTHSCRLFSADSSTPTHLPKLGDERRLRDWLESGARAPS